MLLSNFITILLCCAVGLIFYTYVLYPIAMFLLVTFFKRPIRKNTNDYCPTVSMIISIFNEEKILPEKINNLLNIEYPIDKIEFLLGSDGSTDRTKEILRNINIPSFHIEIFQDRIGKANVLNNLAKNAKGDIIIFSDANTMYESSTVKHLVKHFADKTVGGVCGELVLTKDCGGVSEIGEISYWKYEGWLKKLESKFKTLIGATGGIYAIRKSLFKPLPIKKAVVDDFLIPLEIVRRGYRVVYEPEAKGYEKPMDTVIGEFQRKVRICASNFNSISEFVDLLSPKFGFVAFALWSHKIIRWFVPFLLMIFFLCSAYLSANSFALRLIFEFQIAFIVLGLTGLILETRKVSLGILGLPYYFIAMNAALFVGFIKFILGKQKPTWDVIR